MSSTPKAPVVLDPEAANAMDKTLDLLANLAAKVSLQEDSKFKSPAPSTVNTSKATSSSVDRDTSPPVENQLPNTHHRMESLLNKHVARMQELAKRVNLLNEWMDQDNIGLTTDLADADTQRNAHAVEISIQAGYDLKEALAQTIEWHRGEFKLLCQVLANGKEENVGKEHESDVDDITKNFMAKFTCLPNDEQWADMLAI
ncbi:MAG: hypothetical protein M1827_005283 [Pycnora praestabilis]|nr:MAG: hypothetical protein M1827_005283 [Pycnora praestabilis]